MSLRDIYINVLTPSEFRSCWPTLKNFERKSKMKPNEYQKLAMRTAPKDLTSTELMVNSALGLAGESGEYSDLIKKHMYQGHELDKDHLAKELGDILWYVAMGCEAVGYSMEEVMVTNIMKLEKRYPDGFDSERSQHRVEGDI